MGFDYVEIKFVSIGPDDLTHKNRSECSETAEMLAEKRLLGTQPEDSHLQGKERGPRRIKTSP